MHNPAAHARTCRVIIQLCRPTISLQAVQSVLTVLSLRVHRVRVLWNSSYRCGSRPSNRTGMFAVRVPATGLQ